ncbi:universal stress protein [Baekduia sp.]|jgi:nucleotide-binding universal stress UspA family protein|uniref:universal stress protein n=1 Tax=Baekduia sp. TaxID=2600305 RepID=UPI002E052EB3|nr:universal stress protein [Baekduia sp.]
MVNDTRPVVVSFDGSAPSEAALRVAVAELPGRHLVVVSVWEPSFGTAMLTPTDPSAVAYGLPNPDEIMTVDRLQREHAGAVAEAGVTLAERLGATAEAMPARDDDNVARTVIAAAERCDAALIVVGWRGLGAVKARLLGSTTRRLLHDSRRPVLVVRNGEA